MKTLIKRFLTSNQQQIILKMRRNIINIIPSTLVLLRNIFLTLTEKLGYFYINLIQDEVRSKILDNAPFVKDAQFHPNIKCYVTNNVEYSRSQKTLSDEMIGWIISFKDGDVFFDIGANIGMFSLFTAKHWNDKVKVVSFEPSFSTFTSLTMNVAVNKLADTVSCFQVALGESTRLGMFNYTSLMAGAALHTFDTLRNYRREEFVPVFQQSILSYSLDNFIEIFRIPTPTHIKLDVDGTEMEILRGAKKTLANPKMKSVMIEIVDLSENDTRTLSILNYFNDLNFSCQEKFFHSKNLAFPRISDYFFVKA